MKKSIILILMLLGETAMSVVVTASADIQDGSFGSTENQSLTISYFDSEFGEFDGDFIVEINQVDPFNFELFEFGLSTIGRVPNIYRSNFGTPFGKSDVTAISTEFTSGFFGEENFVVPFGGSIYFNYWFENDDNVPNGPSNDDNYGWIEINNIFSPSGPTLFLGGSAVSNRFGTITGTTQVPEPSAVVMSILGVGLLLVRRRG